MEVVRDDISHEFVVNIFFLLLLLLYGPQGWGLDGSLTMAVS
jgi:hypothetical protein